MGVKPDRWVLWALDWSEKYVGAAIAQGTLAQCAIPPEKALERISEIRKQYAEHGYTKEEL